MGSTLDSQLDAFVEKITVAAEHLRSRISFLQNKLLFREERELFAREALRLRFGDKVTEAQVYAVQHINRHEDVGIDAWHVFNTIQENLVRGFGVHNERTVRRLSSMQRTIDINEGLWALLPQAA